MTKITDMLDQEVQVGDRIASAFRTYYGTAPQLRTGTVVGVVERKSSERTGIPRGGNRPLETHLRVLWDASSDVTQTNLGIQKLVDERAARGVASPHALLNQKYREKTTDILVRLKRFIKIG